MPIRSTRFLGGTYHGPRTTDDLWSLFHQFPRLLGQLGQLGLRYWGYFRPNYENLFWHCEFIICCPSLIHFFYKRDLTQIYPKYDMYWPKIIWKIAIMRSYSVVHDYYLLWPADSSSSRHLALLNLVCLALPNGSLIFNPNSENFSLTSWHFQNEWK